MSDNYDGIAPESIYHFENIYSMLSQAVSDIRKLQKEIAQMKNERPLEHRKF